MILETPELHFDYMNRLLINTVVVWGQHPRQWKKVVVEYGKHMVKQYPYYIIREMNAKSEQHEHSFGEDDVFQ